MALATKLCTVCKHREHAAIDLALSRGVAVKALARRYGLGIHSIYRHVKAHVPVQLKARLLAGPDLAVDLDRLRETEGQSLLVHIVALRHRLFGALDLAEEFGDVSMVTRVSAQLHENLQMTGRLLGELGVGTHVTNNILIQPQYIELRVALVQALKAHPDAARAVAEVLHVLESKAAAEVRPRELAQ